MDLNLSIPPTSASRRTRLRCRRCGSRAEGGSSPPQRGNQARMLAALLLTIEWKRKSAGLTSIFGQIVVLRFLGSVISAGSGS